jgi:hypothetical protein
MAMFIKQSTAVEIKMGPFLDETDGKTQETGLSMTQADVRLAKNGGDWAQKTEATTMVHEEVGWYRCLLDATDTGTVGPLIVAIHEAGALPVWREFLVLPANVYDSFVAGSDALQVHANEMTAGLITAAVIATGAIDADSIAADAITAAKVADGTIDAATFAAGAINAAAIATGAIDADSIAAAAITAAKFGAGAIDAAAIANGAIDAATFAAGAIDAAAIANGAIDAATFAAGAVDAAALAADAVAEIADGVWDEDIVAAHGTADTAGRAIRTLDTIGDRTNNANLNALLGVADTVGADVPSQATDEVWDELKSAHTVADSFGDYLDDEITSRAAPGAEMDLVAGAVDAAAIATDAIDGDAIAASAVTEIQTGLALSTQVDAVEGDLDDIQTRLPAALVGGRIDASVGAMAAATVTAAAIATGAVDADAIAADAVTEIQSGLATSADVSGVQSDTNDIQTRLPAALVGGRMASNAEVVGDKTGYALTAGERDSIAAALLDLANGCETGYTVRQSLRLIASMVAGKSSGGPGTSVYRNLADAADRVTTVADASGNRTTMTHTP